MHTWQCRSDAAFVIIRGGVFKWRTEKLLLEVLWNLTRYSNLGQNSLPLEY